MPKRPPVPPRSVRVPDDLWQAAKARAEENGETVTDPIIRALRRYVSGRSVTRAVAEPDRIRAAVAAELRRVADWSPDGLLAARVLTDRADAIEKGVDS